MEDTSTSALDEEILDLNAEDSADDGVDKSNSENEEKTANIPSSHSDDINSSNEDSGTTTDNIEVTKSNDTRKRAGGNLVHDSAKKQHVIDLTGKDIVPQNQISFSIKSKFKCEGCMSFFVTRAAHEAHRTLWDNNGQHNHYIKKIKAVKEPAKDASKKDAIKKDASKKDKKVVIDLSRKVKTKPIPSVVVERPTLYSTNTNPAFVPSYVKDATNTSNFAKNPLTPQTYIPLVPVRQKKLVPIHPDPGMMTLILNSVKCVVLFDADNMAGYYNLRGACKDIFIWAFYGASMPGVKLWECEHFNAIAEKQRIWLTQCGAGANSADFGMAYHAAQVGFMLPVSVPFIIVSGDNDLYNTMGLLLTSGRRTFMYSKHSHLNYIDDMVGDAFKKINESTTSTTAPTTIPTSATVVDVDTSPAPATPPNPTPSTPTPADTIVIE